MTTFDDREKAFEAKYHIDEELAFKVSVRRDKLLGLWLAVSLGQTGAEADAYARSVVEAGVGASSHDAMLTKLYADLAVQRPSFSVDMLRQESERLLSVAKQQILSEMASGSQNISPR